LFHCFEFYELVSSRKNYVMTHPHVTEPEDNTMLNKVVVFVIFRPKCIFDASKHSNSPTDVTWTTLMMSLFPFWTRTIYHT